MSFTGYVEQEIPEDLWPGDNDHGLGEAIQEACAEAIRVAAAGAEPDVILESLLIGDAQQWEWREFLCVIFLANAIVAAAVGVPPLLHPMEGEIEISYEVLSAPAMESICRDAAAVTAAVLNEDREGLHQLWKSLTRPEKTEVDIVLFLEAIGYANSATA